MSFAARAVLAAGLISYAAGVAVPAAGQNVAAPPGNLPQAGTSQTHWLRDRQTGCRAPDTDFADGTDIVWSGACVNGLVNGAGTLTVLNKGQPQVTISGTFRDGGLEAGHASFAWPDGSKYDGEQIGGKFNGRGVFLSAQQDRLDGDWKDGALNGQATVTWANGNRYEGGWLNGKAEGHGIETWANGDRYDGEWDAGRAHGHGVQVWSNGRSYDGEWRDDQPNGTGKLLRADGTSFTGKFVDGHPEGLADASTKAAPAPQTAASAAPAAGALPVAAVTDEAPIPARARLNDVEGKKLLAVDGSSIALAESEGGFTRAITKPDGSSATMAFTFVNERMGTVAEAGDPTHVAGLFKMTDTEIDVDYSDGHAEVLRPGAGGVTLSLRTTDGQNSCTAWYPEGHVFSEAERKAALAAYASRLGVPLKGVDAKSVPHASACNAPAAASKAASVRGRNGSHAQPRSIPASFEQPASPAGDASSASQQPIVVRTSQVHLIDAQKPVYASSAGGQSAAAQPATMTAPLSMPAVAAAAPVVLPAVAHAPVVAAAPAATAGAPVSPVPAAAPAFPAPQPAAMTAYEHDTSDPGASSCLTVQSDGSHWGFKNGCHTSVQFVYCLEGENDSLASCKDGAISGSAAPDSFSALVTDGSMKEQNVNHQFRWLACSGGAGEVIPKLDGIDPPTGRCLRARTAEK
jgi:hypothetical protein